MLGELLSLGCAVSWAVSVILFKQSEAISPSGINLFKNVVACALIGLTLLVAGDLPAHRSPEDWMRLAVSGVLGLSVADTLFLTALKRLGAAMMAILDCVYAPLVVLCSMVFLGETPGPTFLLGAALVVGGLVAATVTTETVREAGVAVRRDVLGVLLGLGSIALMAGAIVLAKPVLDRGGLIEVSFFRLLTGTVGLVAWLLVRPGGRAEFGALRPQPAWRSLVPASLLGSYVSMLLWLGGMKYTTASRASVLNQLSVAFTLVLARTVLKEKVSPQKALGGAASLAGAIVILWGSAG